MDFTSIKTIGNIGAGTMGHATALQFAIHGYQVNLLDTSKEALDRGLVGIKQDIQVFQKVGILPDTPESIMKRIHPTTDYKTALATADFVIESVIEKLDVKKIVWQEAEKYVSDSTILATNTSGLSPTKIQSVLRNPKRFVVAHFWNPAQLMPLVEVVPGKQTASTTVDTTIALMNHVGKHAVPLKKESLGFVGNRIQLTVLREAFHIIEEGIASPEAVANIVKYSLGRRWSLVGPVASADLGGLDVFKNISSYLYSDLAADQNTDVLLSKMVKHGKLGLKSGKGFFDWNGNAGKKVVKKRDTQLLKLLKGD